MWFDSGSDLIRILVIGVLSYLTVVVVLRLTGKRTLSQLNAFDFIVTVALGSTLATIMLSTDVSFSEGVLALALLAGLQLVVALLSSRVSPVRSFFTSSPALLVRDGEILHRALTANRLGEPAIRQAIRMQGLGGLDRVAAVVLEPNGTLSVVPVDAAGDRWALEDVTDPG